MNVLMAVKCFAKKFCLWQKKEIKWKNKNKEKETKSSLNIVGQSSYT